MPLAMIVGDHATGAGRCEPDEGDASGGERGREGGDAVQLHGSDFLSAVAALANHAPFCQRRDGSDAPLPDAHELRARPLRRSLIFAVTARTRTSRRCPRFTRSCAARDSGQVPPSERACSSCAHGFGRAFLLTRGVRGRGDRVRGGAYVAPARVGARARDSRDDEDRVGCAPASCPNRCACRATTSRAERS